MNIKRVLHVGAHEELFMNYYRNFTTKSIVFDYVLRKGGVDFRFKNDPFFNGKIFYITPIDKSIFSWIIELRKLIKKNDYTHVHFHLGWANIFGLISTLGLNIINISHNHSFYEPKNTFFRFLRKFIKIFISKFSNINLACSIDSGKQMFGNNFILIPNAIEYKNFIFNPHLKNKIKSDLKILSEEIIFGHVGNFLQQKNQDFLINIFFEILKINNSSKLVLVGADYGTMNNAKILVNKLNIESNVLFLGNRNDVNEIMNIFDIFIFPSQFEGFGIALLEAQVSGLPCLYSSSIPKDAIVSPFSSSCSLDKDEKYWAMEAIELLNFGIDDNSRFNRIKKIPNKFDVALVSKELETVYLNYY